MNADSHTPGPWLAGSSITAARPDRAPGSYDRITIAQRVNRPADAWLIGAAPDLLAALEKIVSIMDDRTAAGTNVDGRWMGLPDWSDVEAARAAIASAKGGVA
jgi:hypothetical protein